MKTGYRQWLENEKYSAGTINTQMYRAERVEQHYGDLDAHYDKDHLTGLIDILRYSTNDERHNRPNPTKIPFDGNPRTNLASYRDAVARYRRYRDAGDDGTGAPATAGVGPIGSPSADPETGQRIGLERDMQAALRIEIGQLEAGLTIVDDGAERSVDSGFIDITACDASGTTVVIELKAGAAGQRAIAQILSYMGDVAAEQESAIVRGILVASDFDSKAKAAARMVPNLLLRRYSVRFQFSDGHA